MFNQNAGFGKGILEPRSEVLEKL
jgi:hypothetical protein